MAKKPKKMGRPRINVPMDVVDASCRFNATANQVLEVLAGQGLKISQDTLARAVEKMTGMTFAEYRDKKVDLTRLKLVQKAVTMAMDGNPTMLIFCLKNLCNWKDKNELTSNMPAVVPQVILTMPSNGREAKEWT